MTYLSAGYGLVQRLPFESFLVRADQRYYLIMRRLLFLLLGLIPAARPADAQDSAPRVRVLFIGNSLTFFHDVPGTLQLLALQRKKPVAIDVGVIAPGGMTLRGHYLDTANVARNAIKAGRWDYVVLQEQTLAPITMPDTTLKYATLFIDDIKAANAKALVYGTWNRKSRPTSQDSLNRTFEAIVTRTGSQLVRVGDVWRNVQRADTTINLYSPDGIHQNALGSYAAAVSFYHAIFGELPPASARSAIAKSHGEFRGFDVTSVIEIPPRLSRAVFNAVRLLTR